MIGKLNLYWELNLRKKFGTLSSMYLLNNIKTISGFIYNAYFIVCYLIVGF